MRLADDSNERLRVIQTNTHLEQVQLLKQSEQETIATLLTKQQQEIDVLIQSQTRELEKVRKELDQQYSEWIDSLQSRVIYLSCLIIVESVD